MKYHNWLVFSTQCQIVSVMVWIDGLLVTAVILCCTGLPVLLDRRKRAQGSSCGGSCGCSRQKIRYNGAQAQAQKGR